MEMLIVVAIIAVLAAIAIPAMGRSIHKAKESADLANVRAYYAYLQQDYMSTGTYATSGSAGSTTSPIPSRTTMAPR